MAKTKDDGGAERITDRADRTDAERAVASAAYSAALRDAGPWATLAPDVRDRVDQWVEDTRDEVAWNAEQRRLEDVVIDVPKDGKKDSSG